MPTFKARIFVTLKNGVLDPQGQAIEGALDGLGFAGVNGVRQGKIFDIELVEAGEKEALKKLGEICEKLLANTVIEDYTVQIID
jgi:phosphoribosylformylglycinamidine synthase subunit PurS